MLKAAEVRFYFDEDILGLAHVVAGLRNDCTYPGDSGAVIHKRKRPPCPIERGTKDTAWVPMVAAKGWIIVSRDFNIRENPAERRAVRQNGAKMVGLSGADAASPWAQLELFMKHWRRIEAALDEPGPFIYLSAVPPVPLRRPDRNRPDPMHGDQLGGFSEGTADCSTEDP